jgi:glycopeptide antibiotics resistance protein
MKRKTVLAMLLFAYIVFLFDIALLRFPSANPTPNFVPFRTMIQDWRGGWWEFVVNFVGNIVAFIPMGLIPPLILGPRTKLWHMALFGLSLSSAIEGGQYFSGRRVTDVDDLILNTLGSGVGFVLATGLRGRRGIGMDTSMNPMDDQSRPTPNESATRLM